MYVPEYPAFPPALSFAGPREKGHYTDFDVYEDRVACKAGRGRHLQGELGCNQSLELLGEHHLGPLLIFHLNGHPGNIIPVCLLYNVEAS